MTCSTSGAALVEARGACRFAVGLAFAMLGWVLVATTGLIGVGSARAETAPPKVLTCVFDRGQVNTFENGAFQPKASAPLTFDIGDIDIERQRASLMTASGKGELRVVRAINANHFLEVVTEGFLNLTTVYDVGGDTYPAVHARHLGLLGQPVAAHYQGLCRAKR